MSENWSFLAILCPRKHGAYQEKNPVPIVEHSEGSVLFRAHHWSSAFWQHPKQLETPKTPDARTSASVYLGACGDGETEDMCPVLSFPPTDSGSAGPPRLTSAQLLFCSYGSSSGWPVSNHRSDWLLGSPVSKLVVDPRPSLTAVGGYQPGGLGSPKINVNIPTSGIHHFEIRGDSKMTLWSSKGVLLSGFSRDATHSLCVYVDLHLFGYELVRPSVPCDSSFLSEPLTLPAYKRLQPGGETGASGTKPSPGDDQDCKEILGQEVVVY